jgi:replicative DNA helicase
MTDSLTETQTMSMRAEQAVLGGLIINNDALDRIADLDALHFQHQDHKLIFGELRRQTLANQTADAITVAVALGEKVPDCLRYMTELRNSAVSAVNIRRHADIMIEKAVKRALHALSIEMGELAESPQSAAACVDLVASRLDLLAQVKATQEPERIEDMMADYIAVLEARMDGSIKPVRTGYADLDAKLDGGLERGTLTVVAARPGMGKTAFGLGVARNAAQDGVGMFFSMEMSRMQVADRNTSAIGKIPLKWLRKPTDNPATDGVDHMHWTAISHAIAKTREMNLIIDSQTGLNTIEIRAKARKVRRQAGALDVIVIDQLSFITGGRSDKSYEAVGEHTRALVALAKELDCAVILLCQLNRECEKRPNKRPIMADLAMSGSIEQDAANIIFLYRDEVYNPDTPDRGMCEVNCEKLRQGEPGPVALAYIGNQTRFEDLGHRWQPHQAESRDTPARRGFGSRP